MLDEEPWKCTKAAKSLQDRVHLTNHRPEVFHCVPVQDSIDSCPVDCIHWVDRQQLPALEYVMQRRLGRTNVGIMMSGQGDSRGDVFAATEMFLKEREERWVAQAWLSVAWHAVKWCSFSAKTCIAPPQEGESNGKKRLLWHVHRKLACAVQSMNVCLEC